MKVSNIPNTYNLNWTSKIKNPLSTTLGDSFWSTNDAIVYLQVKDPKLAHGEQLTNASYDLMLMVRFKLHGLV